MKTHYPKIKKVWLLASAIIFMAAACSGCSSQESDDPVAWVNNEPVSLKMFTQRLSLYRNGAFTGYIMRNSTLQRAAFLKNAGTADSLKAAALEECIRIKIQLMLGREKGLLSRINYETFLEEYNALNDQRKEDINQRKLIYGSAEYSESEFFDIRFSQFVFQLKEKLAEDTFRPDKNILREFYSKNKEKLYRKKSTDIPAPYYEYDEVELTVRSNFVDEKYDQLIEQMAAASVIKINSELLNSVKI